jgi:hypothetical protein
MAGLRIIKLQAFFYTDSDDKDKGDGIAETYYWRNKRICGNTAWARDIRFLEFRQNLGQMFNVDIAAEKCSGMKYQMVMETGDKWDVTVHVYAWYSNGMKKRVVSTGTIEFGGKKREETIYFNTCR